MFVRTVRSVRLTKQQTDVSDYIIPEQLYAMYRFVVFEQEQNDGEYN